MRQQSLFEARGSAKLIDQQKLTLGNKDRIQLPLITAEMELKAYKSKKSVPKKNKSVLPVVPLVAGETTVMPDGASLQLKYESEVQTTAFYRGCFREVEFETRDDDGPTKRETTNMVVCLI